MRKNDATERRVTGVMRSRINSIPDDSRILPSPPLTYSTVYSVSNAKKTTTYIQISGLYSIAAAYARSWSNSCENHSFHYKTLFRSRCSGSYLPTPGPYMCTIIHRALGSHSPCLKLTPGLPSFKIFSAVSNNGNASLLIS